MSQGPIEAGVVLTTDNSQYDRSMQSSAGFTQSLGASVDTLSQKIDNLSKAAGKKLFAVSAGDVATITGATIAYAAFEKQMTSLNAQAAVLNKSWLAGQTQAGKYKDEVNSLRREFGSTTRDAAALVQTISKMKDNTAPLRDLTQTFTKMSNATQESATGLASSVLQLMRTMGTPQRETRRYADSLTTLAAGANTSAIAIADFAQQIAPVGKLVGQSQADIQGIATAFIKTGQDGTRAATAYTKVLTDITYATQSGSPDLAKYANFVGMTVDSFKSLSGTEKIVDFFERVNQLGPDAITSLNRMGLDGATTVKAISAVSAQTGGLGASIAKSRAALGDGSVDRGNRGAMQGLTDDLSKLRAELNQTAEAFGQNFAGPASVFIQTLTKMSDVSRQLVSGPFGHLAALIAAIAAPLTAVGGAGLLAAPMLAKLGSVALLARGSGTRGFMEGMRGAPTVENNVAKMNQGPTGMQIAANGSWFQRGQYNAFNLAGQGVGAARERFATNGAPGLFTRAAAAGMNGAAWGVRNFGAGLFSPLAFSGYNDPTQRPRMFNDPRNPFQQMTDAFKGERSGNPTSTWNAERIARVDATRSTGILSAAMGNAAKAAGTMAGALASAGANTAYLGAKGAGVAARGALGWAGRNPTALGIGALTVGTAAGMSSQSLMLGATGLMLGGPLGGLAGAVAGAGFDIYGSHKQAASDREMYAEAMKRGSLTDQYQARQPILQRGAKMSSLGNSDFLLGDNPSDTFNMAKSGLESLFYGKNIPKETVKDAKAADKDNMQAALAFQAIGSERGQDVGVYFGSDKDKTEKMWADLDKVLQSVQPQMEKLGLSTQEVVKAMSGGGSERTNLLSMLDNPGQFTGLNDRISALGGVGSGFVNDWRVKDAIKAPENMNAQYAAVNGVYADLDTRGLSTAQIVRQMGNIRAVSGDPTGSEYMLAQGVQNQALRQQSFQMPFMSRTQQFGAQAQTFAAQRSVMEGDPNQQANMQAAEDQMQASIGSMGEYFKGLLLQQREFTISQARSQEDFAVTRERMDQQYGISRARAQDDFALQRKNQEEDYHLSRMRAEDDFRVAQDRSSENYQRSMKRGQMDFNLSRKRQEQDYQHQVKMMVEQSAKSMYNIYDRVKVEQSSSANYLLFNGQDQLKRMQQQSKDLGTLRKSGVSDDVIQQLGLTDTNNAQQLSRFVAEVANNPQLVSEFNKQVQKRLKAAGALTTDDSSKEWEEFQRQYKVARDRASEDFQRSVSRSHKDFRRQMNQMDQDFEKSMNRQATDYETAQDRQQEAFSKSMKRGATDYGIAVSNMTDDFNKSMTRAKSDLDRMAVEISGSLEDILVRSTKTLGTAGAKQAKVVMNVLKGLGVDFSTEGVNLMKKASEIFGFKYGQGGKGQTSDPTAGAGSGPGQKDNPHGFAEGGVLPGYTPGRDVHTFTSKTGGKLALSGGEAIMVPEWVEKNGGVHAVERMNNEARRGGGKLGCTHGFAEGGKINPDMRVYMDGEPVSAITKAQMLLAESIRGRDYRVMQGSWQAPSSYSGTSHTGPGVVDVSPGDFSTQSDMRRVGFAAWGRNFPGAATAGSGAHVHGVSRLDPGAASHPQLSSFARGEDGLGGPDYGPNPPLLPNLMKKLDQFMNVAVHGGTSPGGHVSDINASLDRLEKLLKPRYPAVEETAAKMTAVGGFPDRYWSKNINKGVRYAVKKATGMGTVPENSNWFSSGGIFTGSQNVNVGEHGPEALIPLNGTGVNFMADLFRRVSVGDEGKATNVRQSQTSVGHTGATTWHVDRSTTFSGPITVQAQNPGEMIAQLKARQRVQAMAQASLGGVRG